MARYLPVSTAFPPEWVAGVSKSALHKDKRLLVRKTGDSIVAAPLLEYNDGLASQNIDILRVVDADMEPDYTCALVNSRLFMHVCQRSPCGQPGRVQAQFQIDFLCCLPIRRIELTTPQQEQAWLVKDAKRLYHDGLARLDLAGGE